MPTLLNTLQGQDLGFLKIVATAWGVDLDAPDARAARPILLTKLSDSTLLREIIETLPAESRAAVEALYDHDGHIPWSKFARDFGEVRVIGAARRDRERPDLNPASPAETLWYRALIGRAFLNLGGEPQEYAYIPDEFLQVIQPNNENTRRKPGRPASPGETRFPSPVNDYILDDACTLLAALRTNKTPEQLPAGYFHVPLPFLYSLLTSAAILRPDGQPDPEQTRLFLEAPRANALAQLAYAWQESSVIDELTWVPDLVFDGSVEHNPLKTRQFLLGQLSRIPAGQWWSLESFVTHLQQHYPDFQRPAGDYDSWFIRSEVSGEFLRGFGHWDAIDGALVRYILRGPLHWLGFCDLATSAVNQAANALRISAWGTDLWVQQPPATLTTAEEKIRIDSSGKVFVPRKTARTVRYQIARFCEWDHLAGDEYQYHLSPRSVKHAIDQGLKTAHFLTLVQRSLAHPLPPSIKTALENWEKQGSEVRIQQAILLRVSNPQILSSLQSGRSARYILEVLSPTSAIIQPGGVEPIRKALLGSGYLTECEIGEE
jgi:hypothetical protein